MNYCVSERLRLRDREGHWELKAEKSEAKVWEGQVRERQCDRLCELIRGRALVVSKNSSEREGEGRGERFGKIWIRLGKIYWQESHKTKMECSRKNNN